MQLRKKDYFDLLFTGWIEKNPIRSIEGLYKDQVEKMTVVKPRKKFIKADIPIYIDQHLKPFYEELSRLLAEAPDSPENYIDSLLEKYIIN